VREVIEEHLTLVSFEITGVCQNRCMHCYYFTRGEVPAYDMPLKRYRQAIDEIAREVLNCRSFGYRGGEPTLHRDFFEVAKYTRSALSDWSIHLSTNGIRLADREFAGKLLNLDVVDGFQVTIQSHLREVHDGITQLEGSWEKTVQAIKNLVEEGANVWTNTPLSRLNAGHILETVRFLAELGVERIIVNKAIFTHAARRNHAKLMLSPEEYGALCYRIKKLAQELGIQPNFPYSFPVCLFDPHTLGLRGHYTCGLGKGVLEVNPAGDIAPCAFVGVRYGNIFEDGLSEAWNRSASARFWKEKESFLPVVAPACANCRELRSCGGINMCEYPFLKRRIKPVR
jgi:radical SAM protein with 4Fe4S-binding SPASM domain